MRPRVYGFWSSPPCEVGRAASKDNAVTQRAYRPTKGFQRGICRYASLTRRHRMSAYDTKRTCRRFVVSEDSLTRHRGAADMARQVIFVAARNPNTPGGGYDTYALSFARAAVRAGFEPHIFCRGSPPGVQETDFGIVQLKWRFRLGVGFCKPERSGCTIHKLQASHTLLSSWTPRNSSTQSRALLVGNPDRIWSTGMGRWGQTSSLPFKNVFGRLTSKSLP